MSARETAELVLMVGGSCNSRAMTADSVLPNGWRYASSPAPTRFPALRPHLRNFKPRPVALHHKPIKALEAGGYLSDSDPRRTDEA
jgi:hypothetical protein